MTHEASPYPQSGTTLLTGNLPVVIPMIYKQARKEVSLELSVPRRELFSSPNLFVAQNVALEEIFEVERLKS